MISFEEIQAAYYMVAATGVLVAATYHQLILTHALHNLILTSNSI